MFNKTYNFFGHELVCKDYETSSWFKLETDGYKCIKKTFSDFKYHRIDTVDQKGFPDILLLKGSEYLLIEGKRLKKKKLVKLEDDLTWQYGQLGFAKRAFTLGLTYMIFVVKNNHIAMIGEETCLETFLSHRHF